MEQGNFCALFAIYRAICAPERNLSANTIWAHDMSTRHAFKLHLFPSNLAQNERYQALLSAISTKLRSVRLCALILAHNAHFATKVQYEQKWVQFKCIKGVLWLRSEVLMRMW